uniref:NAC domain-containing protein n=1 Tax=Oryza rufipogon TaxID=4529 RepID=A0A0E0N0F4_ORYRU
MGAASRPRRQCRAPRRLDGGGGGSMDVHPSELLPRSRCTAPRRLDDDEMDVHPSEQELIETYLRPRVVSGDKPPPSSSSCGFIIHEADVYSADPADLTRGFAPAVARSSGDEAWYFFSAVRGLKGGRKARTVDDGAGCWHSEAGAKPVLAASSGRRLGHRQSFSFITKDDDGQRVRSGWLMVELSLDVDEEEQLVLSKVYFSLRGPGAKKPTTAAAMSRHKRKLSTTDIASPPRRQRRHRVVPSSPPEEPNTSPSPAAAPPDQQEGGDDDPDRGSISWWLRRVFGLTATFTEEESIELNPWLKDILRPFPPPLPPTPPPPCPSPRRKLIDMPEIREFIMRGSYLGGGPAPPRYECDHPAMVMTGGDDQQQLDEQRRDDVGDDRAHYDRVDGQLQFERHYLQL